MFLPVLLLFLGLSREPIAWLPESRIPGPQMDSLSVYIFLSDECLISQFFTPELTRLHARYAGKHVGFVGYFPNTLSTPEKIKAFGEDFRLSFPLLPDEDKTWTRAFGITVTPEAAVWDHREERLIYRGRIDDSYVRVGKRKLHPQHHDLEDRILAWLDHQSTPGMIETQAIGCFITFTDALSPPRAPATKGH